jgi:hypothetical protein
MKFAKSSEAILILALLLFLCFASCRRELSCESCREVNRPPLAHAGSDQTTLLPADSVLLDGSGSTDLDGSITGYQWRLVVGPLVPPISSPQEAQTRISGLLSGVYLFELTATDNGGLSAKDTVQVRVENPAQTNQPPQACTGADQVLTLPINTTTLDGSRSTDPENNITAYQWTKIAGPASYSLTSASNVKTDVTTLTEGVYLFELMITDAGGLFDKDTVQVVVKAIIASDCSSNRPKVVVNATLLGVHPNPRVGMAVVAAGNKLFFAGGQVGTSTNRVGSARVDIYDIATNTWSMGALSVPRIDVTAIASGTKVLFAGGDTGEFGDVTEQYYSAVDIYDLATNTWSVTKLKSDGTQLSAAATDSKVFFAGGIYHFSNGNGGWAAGMSDLVEMYDIGSGTWTETKMSEAKVGLAAATLDNKVYFAGGHLGGYNMSDKIEIYDIATGRWSHARLTEGKYGIAGNSFGNKLYWAGGVTPHGLTCKVEIHDESVNSRAIANLSLEYSWHSAAVQNNKLIYFKPNRELDIYDVTTNSWSVGVLPQGLPYGFLVSTNNTPYLATGFDNTGILYPQIYKLEL